MVIFLGERIINGALEYIVAVSKRPDLKTGVDTYLTDKGKSDLIVA